MRSHGGDSGAEAYEAGEPDEVSMKAGERVLLAAVREAAADTLIVTDGLSCRSQIEHGTRREALHLAQIVRIALRDGVT